MEEVDRRFKAQAEEKKAWAAAAKAEAEEKKARAEAAALAGTIIVV